MYFMYLIKLNFGPVKIIAFMHIGIDISERHQKVTIYGYTP